uniref:glutathione-specific gamma-glutamylcyclotransferase n=1 Tax=Lactuca sativa TaxID=4236 RepID=A0A9R1WU80_LACSA|nr:hypothetical protein LSAT_V11C100004820 [Lactuca sativa]
MVMWVFGYGSLIWKAGFHYDDRLVGFIKDYRRVFYQGSTDHRGTPQFPGRTVTLEPAQGEVCWGVAYKVSRKEDEEVALTYLEVREKQYDKKAYVDFFTVAMTQISCHLCIQEPSASSPAVTGVMVYIASPDKSNKNYLGPATVEEIAKQIVLAEGPSGPNRDYLFNLEKTLLQMGCKDEHVMEIADNARKLISGVEE